MQCHVLILQRMLMLLLAELSRPFYLTCHLTLGRPMSAMPVGGSAVWCLHRSCELHQERQVCSCPHDRPLQGALTGHALLPGLPLLGRPKSAPSQHVPATHSFPSQDLHSARLDTHLLRVMTMLICFSDLSYSCLARSLLARGHALGVPHGTMSHPTQCSSSSNAQQPNGHGAAALLLEG